MNKSEIRTIILHIIVGILVGVLFLHPVTMAVYLLEFQSEQTSLATLLPLMSHYMAKAFAPSMLPMTGVFWLIGGLLGLGSGSYAVALTRKVRLVARLEREVGKTVGSLIATGECATVEFKSSARWDHKLKRVNKALEATIAKTIAGFLNHEGGHLLIGIGDEGNVVGLERDYATLRKKDRDGFELLLVRLVKDVLGGDLCSLIHVMFHEIDGKDICHVLVEPSPRPVYVQQDAKAHYFLRTGNATVELDIREALEHVAARWPKRV